MSWGITVAGKGADVAEAAQKSFDASKQYSGSEPHHEIVDALSDAVRAFAVQFPDKIVTVESGGHIDSSFGDLSLKVRVFPST